MLVDNYSRMRASAIEGSAASRRQMIRKGENHRGDALWTEAEDAICRHLYPDYTAMLKVMRHRSYNALKHHCRDLKIVDERHVWTNQEVLRLRKIYATSSKMDLIEAFPGISMHSIRAKASFLRLRKKLQPLAPTGNRLLDEVRTRRREIKYSMTDLDDMAGTGTYFQKAKWCRKPPDIATIKKAVEAIGGRFTIDWGE